MKFYEENPPEYKVLDIVPISGLVLSFFVRQENELRTVLDLWDHNNEVVSDSQVAVSKEGSFEKSRCSSG